MFKEVCQWYADEIGRDYIEELGFCERLERDAQRMLDIANTPEGSDNKAHYITQGRAKWWLSTVWDLVEHCESLRDKLQSLRQKNEQYKYLNRESQKDQDRKYEAMRRVRDRYGRQSRELEKLAKAMIEDMDDADKRQEYSDKLKGVFVNK